MIAILLQRNDFYMNFKALESLSSESLAERTEAGFPYFH